MHHHHHHHCYSPIRIRSNCRSCNHPNSLHLVQTTKDTYLWMHHKCQHWIELECLYHDLGNTKRTSSIMRGSIISIPRLLKEGGSNMQQGGTDPVFSLCSCLIVYHFFVSVTRSIVNHTKCMMFGY